MVLVVGRTAWLLGAERDEDDRQPGRPPCGQPGQLEQHRDAARVVLGAGRLRHGVQVRPDQHVRRGRVEVRAVATTFVVAPASTAMPHELPVGTRTD